MAVEPVRNNLFAEYHARFSIDVLSNFLYAVFKFYEIRI